jgi:preprotein translocase subunit SecD
MIDLRDNLRIIFLLVLIVLATLALFGPLGAGSGGASEGLNESQRVTDPTNLQYGLELAGGTRVRGQLVGQTAQDVGLSDSDDAVALERSIVDGLNSGSNVSVEGIDVNVRSSRDAVELYKSPRNISKSRFASVLTDAGLDVSASDIRNGTTEPTRNNAVEVLQNRVDETGLGGTRVTKVDSPTGGEFILVEVPGEDRESVRDLIGRTGRVQVMLGYPDPNNETAPQTETVLEGDDFEAIPGVRQQSTGPNQETRWEVAVRLDEQAANRLQNRLVETGFTDNPGSCAYNEEDGPAPNQYCLYTVSDGDIIYGASLDRRLAETMEQGQFDGNFVLTTGTDEEAARDLAVNLRAGALPTRLQIDSINFISPSLAQQFKPLALATALIAWLAVSLVVYFWYRDPRVAIPMLLTAGSEVYLLLGFAAAIGLALDLGHIAGLIAVIGTGLDDLIIMADEILQRDKRVQTGRVFQSRFRKAFWVIGMAAATTIVAMSPLMFLSLGDLRGFAIVTIVGVLIGVAVTRPAYGDILRKLVLEDDVSRN